MVSETRSGMRFRFGILEIVAAVLRSSSMILSAGFGFGFGLGLGFVTLVFVFELGSSSKEEGGSQGDESLNLALSLL